MPARDEVEDGRPFAPRFYCGGDDPTCPVHGLDRDDDTPKQCAQTGITCSTPESPLMTIRVKGGSGRRRYLCVDCWEVSLKILKERNVIRFVVPAEEEQ